MNWKKKIEKSTIYLLVSLVTFILYVFSYVPLYVIYLYIYTYVHTLSLRITSLFFLCFPCSVIIFCLCLCLFIYIYIFVWSYSRSSHMYFFCFIIPITNVFDSVTLPIIFCQCLIITSLIRLISTYSRIFCTPFSIACLSSFLCFHFIIFLFFSLNHSFFFFFFFCICLSCLSTCVLFVIFDLTAAAYNSRETNIRSMIQHFQFYLYAIWEISMFNNNLLIEIYINLLNFNSNCICLTFILLEIILEPYSIDNKINLCYP